MLSATGLASVTRLVLYRQANFTVQGFSGKSASSQVKSVMSIGRKASKSASSG